MPQATTRKSNPRQVGREAARDCAVLVVALLALMSVRISVTGDAASNTAASASLLPVQPAVAATHDSLDSNGAEPAPAAPERTELSASPVLVAKDTRAEVAESEQVWHVEAPEHVEHGIEAARFDFDFDWQFVQEDGRELIAFVRESIEQDGKVTLDVEKLRALTIHVGERLGVELEAVKQAPAVRRVIHRLKAARCEDARSTDSSC